MAGLFENKYVIAILAIFLVLYYSRARIALPESVVSLFRNSAFRVFYLALLLLVALKQSPVASLIIAVIFVLTMQYISDQDSEREAFRIIASQ